MIFNVYDMLLLGIFIGLCSSHMIDLSFYDGWDDYKRLYGLKFGWWEEDKRRRIFRENSQFIKMFNYESGDLKLGMNKFGHLRASEVIPGLDKISIDRTRMKVTEKESNVTVNRAVDWRSLGVVTRVKNQGVCDSSYAFSGVGALESHSAIKTGVLAELSEQEIIDCSTFGHSKGCDGGFSESVFTYARVYGLSSENEYNYTGIADGCKLRKVINSNRPASYVDLPSGNEKKLIEAVSSAGPVAIQLDAGHKEFIFYKSGVLDISGCNNNAQNHAALVVGYDMDAVGPYYIIKNSWGTDWGDNGYAKIVMNKNMCGIAASASYPVMRPK